MAYRALELTLISANVLKKKNFFKLIYYALAKIAGDSRTKQRTPADHNGGKNPSWNSTLRFTVPAGPAASNNLNIHVLLRRERTLGDRDVGEVYIPVKELLDGFNGVIEFVSYQLQKPGSNKPKGILNLSYKFVDLHEGSSAYSPSASAPPPYLPPHQGGYGYSAPPQAGYGYGAPHGYGYGAPPQQGYGHGAPLPPRTNGTNMLTTIGGLVLSDMISDELDYAEG